MAAAFGRLCVETKENPELTISIATQPPSGGCVLKQGWNAQNKMPPVQPPSGGCVLKLAIMKRIQSYIVGSRLRAAVC